MSNKQIFELQAAQALVPEDQVLISQAAGNLTRRASLASLPVRVDDAAGHARTLAAKLGVLKNELKAFCPQVDEAFWAKTAKNF